ncbi:MAG: divergent polysaccharide deacetylase family protein [Treponema sp.]|nr:divergent polysaccharide deacetylase family protein [Treponema sp.]
MSKKKKPKFYIPTYKIIIFCGVVIVFCLCLLLGTTIAANKNDKKEKESSISQRFEYPEKKELREDITKGYAINPKTSKSQSEKKAERNTENKKTAESDGNESSTKDLAKKNVVKSESQKKQNKTESEKSEDSAKNIAKSSTETTKNMEALEVGKAEQKIETVEKSSGNKTENKIENKQKTESKTDNNAKTETEKKAQPVETKKVTTVATTENLTTNRTKDFGFPQAVNNAQLVFVFDDGGQNLNHLEKFFSISFPITIAVLPRLAHSRESAEKIRASGNELILHQPMQAVNSKVNPGPGAITPSMTEDEIISTLFQNINEIGPIAGMNNHEGSAITADAEKMSVVMRIASENGIYFLDSRTNVETTVPYVAGEMGYSYYERNVFLDNTKNRDDILNEIKKGLSIANKNGVAIMIGHIWSADILPELLNEIYPELRQKGYTFSTVSKSKGKKQ